MWTLDDLRWHYGEAYCISYRLGRWRAVRRDNGRVLDAGGPDQLVDLIREDYARQPVPRDLARG